MYKVTCLYGGKTYMLHDPLSDELRIYNDELETETNEPGSFKFTVSCDHPYMDKIIGLSSDIRVYDGAEEIWRGRPVDDGEDLYRARTFKCEGELAFFYDSIQPRREIHDISPLQFFTLLVEEHNTQVRGKGPIDKTFRVGVVTVTDTNDSLYRYTNRETTLDDLHEKITDRLGGYLRTRISNGIRYIDLLEDTDTVSDQPIQLGENLLDYARDTDYTQVATACIPLGESLEESEIPALDAYLTVASVNNGSDIIQINTAVSRYGFICKVLNYDDITVPANLKAAGQKWLQDGQYEQMTLDLTAVDLHALGYEIQPIRINTKVRVLSTPHGMDRYFAVSKRTYHLTQPEADTVSFGVTERRQSYTKSNKHNTSNSERRLTSKFNTKIAEAIDEERRNVSEILNLATHGYVVLDPNDGPERILIMDTNSTDSAQKIWKFDMNGLGYSKAGIKGPWGVAITMNGEICADYILTGKLMAELIKVGILQDVKGLNFWNMETGEFALASATKVGGKTVDDIASGAADKAIGDFDDTLTQQDIFNRLTQNGKTQGIYLKNGRLYINATYIDTGELTAALIKSGKITSKNGKVYFDLDNNEIHCDLLVSTSSSAIVARVGTGYQGGSTGTSSGGGYPITGLLVYSTAKPKYAIALVPGSSDSDPDQIRSGTNGLKIQAIVQQGGGGRDTGRAGMTITPNGYTMICGQQNSSHTNASNVESGGTTQGMIIIEPYYTGSGTTYQSAGEIKLKGNVYCNRTIEATALSVSGTKKRVVKTENYEERMLYCYEMPSPMFGDVGEGRTDENGECYIDIDDIFNETIRSDIEYQVFLQKEGQGDIWVEEKEQSFFYVKGTPNLKFAWELKAKQAGFETERLECRERYEAEENMPSLDGFLEMELEDFIAEQEEILYETA